MTIGEKICDLRREKKMTQKDLAMKLNVSDNVISRWENGKSIPDAEMLLKVAEAFQITIPEIYQCIEKVDINNEEKYSEEQVWFYKKYTVIAISMAIVSPILLLFIKLFGSLDNLEDRTRNILNSIFFFISLGLFLVSVVMEIVVFLKLFCFSKTKYYQLQYRKVLIHFGISYVMSFLLSIISNLLIIFL
ncbi:MAG: helix-turn-helix domain-containing protein [Anaeroplasmataceae bacterium]|jgi:Predicted transcription factor, homolog of eukaryotic MBF1|nr:helix-turn-helix domain-containing protein [Anaeroplasmataceae bacterium]